MSSKKMLSNVQPDWTTALPAEQTSAQGRPMYLVPGEWQAPPPSNSVVTGKELVKAYEAGTPILPLTVAPAAQADREATMTRASLPLARDKAPTPFVSPLSLLSLTNVGKDRAVLPTVSVSGEMPSHPLGSNIRGRIAAGGTDAETLAGLVNNQWQPHPQILKADTTLGDIEGRARTQNALDAMYGTDEELAMQQDPRYKEMESLAIQSKLDQARQIAASGGADSYRANQALQHVQQLTDMLDKAAAPQVKMLQDAAKSGDPVAVQALAAYMSELEQSKSRMAAALLGMRGSPQQ